MIPFILLGMIVGALLGLRWAVLALLPAGIFLLVGIGGAGLLLGWTISWIGSAMLLSVIGLQLGYLVVTLLRYAGPTSSSTSVQPEFRQASKPEMKTP